MGYKHPITPPLPSGVRLRWQGVIDFGELYRFMKWWLQDNGYCDDDGFTEDSKCMETKYVERRFQGGTKNIEIDWKTYRDVGHFRHNIGVTILILGMRDEETELRGVKRKLDRGDFDIRMDANVETEFNEAFEKHWFSKFYYRFFMKGRLSMHKRNAYINFYRFHNAIKDYIQNQRY
ncbi:MAG TPA: hypothetical protein VJJ21_01525 [Candidatus Nanoarchaeia archaeon]|nr:hypothetical protein [Candidatus Nanoarchaeia archaeon]